MSERLHFVQGLAAERHADETNVQSATLPPIDDHYKWGFEQAAHIRAGRFDLVDILNVADEIEDVAKRERRAVVSNVEIVLLHMLKWEYQPARRSMSWIHSIEGHRDRLNDDIRENPSLRAEVIPIVERAYKYARRVAAKETKLSIKMFPSECPFSWSHIIDAVYELDRD